MARRKKGPKSKGPPPHIRHKFASSSKPNDSSFSRSHGYTLAEEARNTASNRRGRRGPDAGLRHQPVIFISAGFIDPLKQSEVSEQNDSPVGAEPAAVNPAADGDEAVSAADLAAPLVQPQVLDSKAHATVPQCSSEHQEDGVDIDSDSSEEVILFKGRNANYSRPEALPTKPASCLNDGGDVADQCIANPETRTVEDPTNLDRPLSRPLPVDEDDYIALNQTRGKRPYSHKRHKQHRKHPHIESGDDDEEAAIIADYIANMQANLSDSDENDVAATNPVFGDHSFSILRDLGGTDSDAISCQPSSGDDSGDELDEDLDDDELDNEPDSEVDATAKREQELEDERLAQLLSQQPGLDFVDDGDFLPFDGTDSGDGWVVATSVSNRRKKSAPKKSKMFQRGSQFPNATRMAEAFDELDLMDMQNLRFQRSKKGPLSLGILDPELEDALNATVKKDRLKKAGKKNAREELRSLGLLGKNVAPHDLRTKYRGGMSLDDLAEEVQTFILSTQEQLILPPLDKSARKTVHTIANNLKLKSKSAGAGVGRYPVLYRTKGTLQYDEVLFEHVFSQVRRTWFPRVDVDEKVVQQIRVLKQAETRVGRSRTGNSSLTLHEGDVVGKNASEIGVDNKGRAMLEKMGWSKGMSLGTMENKGITVPLMHVMKKSKAGLGEL